MESSDSEAVPAEENRGVPILRWSRILVADDSPMVCHLITAKLRRFCIRVDVVADGRQAVSAVLESLGGNSPFELILMDARMPNLDGLDATRRIRESGYTGPVIAMTASDVDEDRKAAIEAGSNEFVVKPFNWLTLFTKMRRLLPPSH